MKPLIGTDLKRFLRDYRREFRPNLDLTFLLQSVEYPYNVGAIFRLADGVGVTELLLTGITPTPPHPTVEKIGRYKHHQLPWRYVQDPLEALRQLKAQAYHILAVELVDDAQPYHQYPYPAKTCLVVGHEDHGLTKATLALCDAAVFVPMYGKGQSHNVATSLAIVAYHALHARA